MKTRHWPFALTLACMLSAAPFAAGAQPGAAPASAAASAPRKPRPAPKPAPRPLTPDESRESAAPPGMLRPEHPATPQIALPIGKQAPATWKSARRTGRSSGAASATGVDDATARCKAEPDEHARAVCRDKLKRESRGREAR